MLLPTADASDQFSTEEKSIITNSVSLRLGPVSFDQTEIQQVFGTSTTGLHLEIGASLYDFVNLYAGTGFIQQMGVLVNTAGVQSTEHDMLTIYPMALGGTVQAKIVENQILIPYASGGIDFWLWRENWVENDTEQAVSGGKSGWHYAFGGHLLLDFMDEVAASKLFVRFGVKDTYFTGEYRVQQIGEDGIIFDGSSATFGLRFVY